MARIRSIKPTFASDSKVARLSLQARLTFLLLLPEADDEGRMVGSTKRLAGALYPNDDKVGVAQVDRWIGELERERMVVRYTVDGSQYLAITNFAKHQNPQHPKDSTLPAPPSDSGDAPSPVMNPSRKIRDAITKPSSLSVEGVERERERENSSAPAKPDASKRATGPPAEFVLDDELRAWAGTNTPTISDELRLQRETERFLDHHRAKGSTFKDWRAAWRTWMNRAVDYAPRALPALASGVTAQDLSMANVDSVFDQLKEASR